jgi:hypothetical protein
MVNFDFLYLSEYLQIIHGLKTSKGHSSFWHGEFQVPCDDEAAKDTFLSLPGWSKGVAFINGFNLGRYVLTIDIGKLGLAFPIRPRKASSF